MSDTEYDLSGNSNLSFHIEADILDILIFYDSFIFFYVYMLWFDKVTYLSLLFKFILYEILDSSLWGSDVLLFLEFINIVSINIVLYCCILFLSSFIFLTQRIYNLNDFI